MSDPDVQIRALLHRALAEAESLSSRRASEAIVERTHGFGHARPVAVSLVTAGAMLAGILTIGPRLHPTPATVAATPSPSPTLPTLLPSLAPTLVPAQLPSLPAVLPTAQPTPGWQPPPQTVTEPQLFYANSWSANGSKAWAVDWTGSSHARLDAAGALGCSTCTTWPASFSPQVNASPDGSHVIVAWTTVVGPDGSRQGTLPGGSTWDTSAYEVWDDDNRHICRLDGPGHSQLSWLSLGGASRAVTTLPAPPWAEHWAIVACNSARNRIVVARMDDGTQESMIDLRSIELSTGRLIHDIPAPDPGNPNTWSRPPTVSGDGTVVAVGEGLGTKFINPDTGSLLHFGQGYWVDRLSWYGHGALVHAIRPPNGTVTYEVIDTRDDLVLWTAKSSPISASWSRESSDDLAVEYEPQDWIHNPPQGGTVVIVKASGVAAQYATPS